MFRNSKSIAIGLVALMIATGLAQVAQSANYGAGALLTDPDRLARGYYESLATGAETFYDPTMPMEQATGAVYLSTSNSSAFCTKAEALASSENCQSWSGSACNWQTIGRTWWQPDALGYYYDTDYRAGRCSELRVVNENNALKAYFRAAIRANSRVDANPSVQGTWEMKWTVKWLKADDGLIPSHPSYQPENGLPLAAGQACVPDARDVTLRVDFANCVWGAAAFNPAANLTSWKTSFPNDANLDLVKGFRLHGTLLHTTTTGITGPIEADLICSRCLGS